MRTIRSRNWLPPFHLLTILLVCLTISPAICPATSRRSAEASGQGLTPNLRAATVGSKVTLANDTVCFEFEPEHLGLTSMTALAAGVNHIQSVENKPTLWQLTFHRGTQQYNLSSTDVPCTSHTVDKLASDGG